MGTSRPQPARGRSSTRARAWAVALVAALALVLTAAPASALDNGLARTPYMGWDTYFEFGGAYNQQTIEQVADAMVRRGLRTAGYRYVWLDAGWWSGARDRHGRIVVNRRRWPQGMRWLTHYLHVRGLLAGIYTDAGRNGCDGRWQGSYGHYRQDANQFAAWGFDAVKVDFCGAIHLGLNPASVFGSFSNALLHNASHRPLLFNLCNWYTPGRLGPDRPSVAGSAYDSYSFAPRIANSWRTDTDVGFLRNVTFDGVLRNLDSDSVHAEAAGPGHWNDPDYLAPQLGLTNVEAQTQFAMWAIVAAPLMVSSDVRTVTSATLATLTNRDILAIDQDPLGAQGVPVASSGAGQVWVKRLANGDRAVALLNRGNSLLTISTTARALGLPATKLYAIRDLWAHQTTYGPGAIAATVAPHAVAIYRVGAR